MKKNYFIVFVFICFLSCTSNIQSDNYTYADAYNLNFKLFPDSTTLYPFSTNAAYQFSSFSGWTGSDSLFSFIYFEGLGSTDHLITELEQRILLPDHNKKNGSITFEGRGETLNQFF